MGQACWHDYILNDNQNQLILSNSGSVCVRASIYNTTLFEVRIVIAVFFLFVVAITKQTFASVMRFMKPVALYQKKFRFALNNFGFVSAAIVSYIPAACWV